ncbi:MAG: L-threonylcarbamoyladenylate synthase [Vicinamibacterales bacterium]
MAIILKVDALDPDPAVIREAADMIRDGLVVAYPTDTLYGLATDPRNAAAVRRLFELKGRPETSALPLIAAEPAHARAAGDLSASAERLATRWWPGPLTIVIPARPILARETLAGGSTVAVRIPDSLVATAFARDTGFCVTATSANRSGEPAASTADAVVRALPDVDAIIDAGPSPGGVPSTIVDASRRVVTLIRDGAVPWDRVLRSLQ